MFRLEIFFNEMLEKINTAEVLLNNQVIAEKDDNNHII